MPSFLDLGVDAALAQRLESSGITTPRPVQAAVLREALAGRDICAQAPTGSGKTLAFGLPLLAASRQTSPGRPSALVLVPTRELAEQVRGALGSLLGRHAERVTALYGGTAYGPQFRALRRADIAVACPGRLEDLVARGDIRLDGVHTVVLDEADRMVDMGFWAPVQRLVDQTAEDRQVMLFSATIGPDVERISRRYQHEPHRVTVEPEPTGGAPVAHLFWRTTRPERVALTARLVGEHGQAFVFCRTKHGADRLARQLRDAGVESAPIHGDRSQAQRTKALAAFASRRARALVATDVVARGIHVADVPCVVHFDPPADADTYVHRSGRTGRSGKGGTVVSLVHDDVQRDVTTLQRQLGLTTGVTPPFAPVSAPATPAGAPATTAARLTGTVKYFDGRRGFGFVSTRDGAELFVHHSQVRHAGAGRGQLRTGESVSFEIGAGRRGDEARTVEVLSA